MHRPVVRGFRPRPQGEVHRGVGQFGDNDCGFRGGEHPPMGSHQIDSMPPMRTVQGSRYVTTRVAKSFCFWTMRQNRKSGVSKRCDKHGQRTKRSNPPERRHVLRDRPQNARRDRQPGAPGKYRQGRPALQHPGDQDDVGAADGARRDQRRGRREYLE